MAFINVVLPAPFGPIRPTISPGPTMMSSPSSAAMPPKCTATSSTTKGGAPVTGDVADCQPMRASPSCLDNSGEGNAGRYSLRPDARRRRCLFVADYPYPCCPAVEVGLPRFLNLAGDAVWERIIEPTTPMPLKNSKNPTFWPKEPNRPLKWGPMKKVPMYNSTAAATAPPSDPRPPMTGMANTAIEMSAVNCVGDTLCQSRAQKHPGGWPRRSPTKPRPAA